MNEDDLREHTEKVLFEARKAIAEANQALERSDSYFIEHKITTGQLMEYVKLHGGPDALRDLDRMVENSLNEIKAEAQKAIDEAYSDQKPKSSRKKFHSLI